MDLWILSQDGTILINTKNLLIDDNDNSIYTVETLAIGVHTANLGKYESKERALEILQEIKRHIAFLNVEMGAGRFGELDFESDVVFEMPEK